MIHDYLTSLLIYYQNFLKTTEITSPTLFFIYGFITSPDPVRLYNVYLHFVVSVRF